jgi:hypothetical protein
LDTLPYIDQMYTDLGLECHRKKGMFAEMFEHCRPPDYKGIVEEWIALHNGSGSGGKGSKADCSVLTTLSPF